MELHLYWRIIKKRAWIVLTLLLVCLLSYILFPPRAPASYVANMRFVVGIQPEPPSRAYYTYDRYYTWLTAEYLLDDLSEVVKSQVFAQDVATLAGVAVSPGSIQGSTSAGKLHRILNISITWHDGTELAQIADGVVLALQAHGSDYFAQLSTDSAVISLIDPPTLTQVGPSLRQRLDLPLRLILSLVAGIGLAFLLDYLDVSIRDRADLKELGLPIFAEIPARRHWLDRLLLRHRPLP